MLQEVVIDNRNGGHRHHFSDMSAGTTEEVKCIELRYYVCLLCNNLTTHFCMQRTMKDFARNLEIKHDNLVKVIDQVQKMVNTTQIMISEMKQEQTHQADRDLQNKRKAENALLKHVDLDKTQMMKKARKAAQGASTTGPKRTKKVSD